MVPAGGSYSGPESNLMADDLGKKGPVRQKLSIGREILTYTKYLNHEEHEEIKQDAGCKIQESLSKYPNKR